MIRQHYTLGETAIEVRCGDPQQARRVYRLWHSVFNMRPLAALRHNRPASSAQTGAPAVIITLNDATQPVSPPSYSGAPTQSGALQGWQTEQGYLLQCHTTWLDINVQDGCCQGFLTNDFWEQPLAEQREFFLVAFLMLLRQFGYYGLHANGIAKNGTGFLIIGESGSGKTTLTMNLVRNGWGYLADDAILLHESNTQIQAYGLRRGFSCLPETMSRSLGTENIYAHSQDLMDGKRLVDIDYVRPGCAISEMTPSVLLFSRIEGGSHSQIVPLQQTQAMGTLMRLSTGILTDKASVNQQLALLRQLVGQAQSFALLLGEDVFENPAAVSDLLWTTRREYA